MCRFEIEEELNDYATVRGLSPDEVVLEALREFFDQHGLQMD
jgi:hypothetical protein